MSSVIPAQAGIASILASSIYFFSDSVDVIAEVRRGIAVIDEVACVEERGIVLEATPYLRELVVRDVSLIRQVDIRTRCEVPLRT